MTKLSSMKGVETRSTSKHCIPAEVMHRKLHTRSLLVWGVARYRKGENPVKLQLTSHINNSLRGLWLLKITYLDASFNVGNWTVADDSCKSTEYSRFEVTSKHKNRKQKLLSIWSIHWNIPFKSYDGKNNLTFLCIIQFWFFRWIISCICLLQENAYINICLIRVPLRLLGIILYLQRKAF